MDGGVTPTPWQAPLNSAGSGGGGAADAGHVPEAKLADHIGIEEEDDDVEHDAASPEGGAVAAKKKKKTPSKDLEVEAPITSGTADVLHNHPLRHQGTSQS